MAKGHPPEQKRSGSPFRSARFIAALLLGTLTVASLTLLRSGDWRVSRDEASLTQPADEVSAICDGEECPLRLLAGMTETRPGHYLDAAGLDAASAPELWLCYATEGGLLNQHLGHIVGLAMAIGVGATGIIMPPTRVRKTWASVEETQWEGAPVESTWDIASFTRYAAARGVEVTTAPAELPFNHMPTNTTQQCFGSGYNPQGFTRSEVVSMPHVQYRFLSLRSWGELVREQIEYHAVRVAKQDKRRQRAAKKAGKPAPKNTPPPRQLLLNLASNLMALKSRGEPLMTEVAMNLHFSPMLRTTAARVAANILQKHRVSHFNGMHLRVEVDAQKVGWFKERGGADMVWEAYANATVRAGFNASVPLYVASGIFNDVDATDQRQRLGRLGRDAASNIVEKTPFLRKKERRALSLGQLAVIDFLVLARAKRLVLFNRSSFSIFLHQFRKLHHLPVKEAICVFGDLPCSQLIPIGPYLFKGVIFDAFERGDR